MAKPSQLKTLLVLIYNEFPFYEPLYGGFIPIHRHNTTTFVRNPIRIFDMDWY